MKPTLLFLLLSLPALAQQWHYPKPIAAKRYHKETHYSDRYDGVAKITWTHERWISPRVVNIGNGDYNYYIATNIVHNFTSMMGGMTGGTWENIVVHKEPITSTFSGQRYYSFLPGGYNFPPQSLSWPTVQSLLADRYDSFGYSVENYGHLVIEWHTDIIVEFPNESNYDRIIQVYSYVVELSKGIAVDTIRIPARSSILRTYPRSDHQRLPYSYPYYEILQ